MTSFSSKFLHGLKKTVTPRNLITGFLIRLELVISDGSCHWICIMRSVSSSLDLRLQALSRVNTRSLIQQNKLDEYGAKNLVPKLISLRKREELSCEYEMQYHISSDSLINTQRGREMWIQNVISCQDKVSAIARVLADVCLCWTRHRWHVS